MTCKDELSQEIIVSLNSAQKETKLGSLRAVRKGGYRKKSRAPGNFTRPGQQQPAPRIPVRPCQHGGCRRHCPSLRWRMLSPRSWWRSHLLQQVLVRVLLPVAGHCLPDAVLELSELPPKVAVAEAVLLPVWVPVGAVVAEAVMK
jgi:hypothetical protein